MDRARPLSNEDKQAWCVYGESRERLFCAYLIRFGITAIVNPEKKADKYACDLLIKYNNSVLQPADLKSVLTPFFKADEHYGLDPQYAVTFNHKDGVRYRERYPDIVVYFDVLFRRELSIKTFQNEIKSVRPMHVVAMGSLNEVAAAIKACGNKEHRYKARVDDTCGNAKASWIFDVRKLLFLEETYF